MNGLSFSQFGGVVESQASPILSKIKRLKEFSDDDEIVLMELLKKHSLEDKIPVDVMETLKLYRKMYRVRRGVLPRIKPDFVKSNFETVYNKIECSYFKKDKTKVLSLTSSYQGVSYNVKVSDHIRYRNGVVSRTPANYECEKTLKMSDGTLYLSNLRILFIGTSATREILLKDILTFKVYRDGLLLLPSENFFCFTNKSSDLEIEIFATILSKILGSM